MSPLVAIVTAILCILANGFFVAAEFAIVKVRGTRVEELVLDGNRRARLVKHIIEHLDAYLSACQLGITIASLGLGWVGEPAFAEVVEPALAWAGVDNQTVVKTVSFAIAFGLISFFHIVVGEQAPKSMAVRNPDGWSLAVAYPLHWFSWLMFPFIWVLNRSANGLLRLFRVEAASEGEMALSEEELRMVVATSHRSGVLDKYERELLDNVFDFGESTVHEIMVPRTRMACLFVEKTFEENLAIIRETMHTRYPLVREDKDTVLGMVHLKDLYFALLDSHGAPPDLAAVKREVLAVPDTMSISDLLALFRAKRTHMAIAVDEFGGTSGLLTLEDLIEELVGEIGDEFDEEEEPIVSEGAHTWSVHGSVSLKDVTKVTGVRIEDDDVDSVGGLVMMRMKRIPRQGERVQAGALEFEILRMNAFEVGRVRVHLRREDEFDGDDAVELPVPDQE